MLDITLLRKLENWRRTQAEIEGVELFRILPNQTLHAIIIANARTKDALLEIKGIKDRKFAKYGAAILDIMNGVETEIPQPKEKTQTTEEKNDEPVSVSVYLDQTNRHLFEMKGKVRGEVTQFQSRGSAIYFTIKDTEDSAVLSCFMWGNAYALSGVELEEGMEIVVHGFPQIYKPSGRLSLNATFLELVGEGALKQAYEKLKLKLTNEGIFDSARKKELPFFPKKIGLITSRDGAVIHDFLNNLGTWGFDIRFVNSRVEGVYALRDLQKALRYFKKSDIDVLVIIRGGGSLESFQAFNNETIVREIADMPMPVIAGLGHHEDVPLSALAADVMTSTPTAVTSLLNSSWQEARNVLLIYERKILDLFRAQYSASFDFVESSSRLLTNAFAGFIDRFAVLERRIQYAFNTIQLSLVTQAERLRGNAQNLQRYFSSLLDKNIHIILQFEKTLIIHDPMRQLRLGFGILQKNGKVIKSIQEVKRDDKIQMILSDGSADATINKTIRKK